MLQTIYYYYYFISEKSCELKFGKVPTPSRRIHEERPSRSQADSRDASLVRRRDGAGGPWPEQLLRRISQCDEAPAPLKRRPSGGAGAQASPRLRCPRRPRRPRWRGAPVRAGTAPQSARLLLSLPVRRAAVCKSFNILILAPFPFHEHLKTQLYLHTPVAEFREPSFPMAHPDSFLPRLRPPRWGSTTCLLPKAMKKCALRLPSPY